jgi:hypothetical protein
VHRENAHPAASNVQNDAEEEQKFFPSDDTLSHHRTLEFHRFRLSCVRRMRSSRCRRVVAKSRRRYISSIREACIGDAVSGPEAAGRLMQSGGVRFRDIDARKRQCDADTGASREQKQGQYRAL